jgi:hypothetical protein
MPSRTGARKRTQRTKAIRQSVTIPEPVATEVRRLAKERHLTMGRALLVLAERGLRAESEAAVSTENLVPMVCTPTFTITKELQFGKRRFLLREPIEVRVNYEGGVWTHEAPALAILAYAENRVDSLNSFCMDFADRWDCIACEDDERLTGDARQVKRKLQRIVQSVS